MGRLVRFGRRNPPAMRLRGGGTTRFEAEAWRYPLLVHAGNSRRRLPPWAPVRFAIEGRIVGEVYDALAVDAHGVHVALRAVRELRAVSRPGDVATLVVVGTSFEPSEFIT